MEISPELVLGIIGSATGISSLLIEFKKYLRDRPKIQAEIVYQSIYLKLARAGSNR